MHKFLALFALTALLFAGSAAFAQEEGTDIGDEIINTSLNAFVRSGDAVTGGTIIQPRPGDDVDLIITAIADDGQFDPVMTVRDFDGSFLASNDDWTEPEGGQAGFPHDLIECYVEQGVIAPADEDAVVIVSLDRVSGNERRAVLVDVTGFQGDSGQVVVSFLQVDGALFLTHECADF